MSSIKNSNILFIILKINAFLLICSLFLFKLNLLSELFTSWFLISLQVVFLFCYRKFKPLAFLVIFTIPYTLVAHLHFLNPEFKLYAGYITDFTSNKYFSGVMVILGLFWAVVSLVLPNIKSDVTLKKFIVVRDDRFIFYFLLVIQVLILLFGRTGTSIFESGGYANEDASVKSLGGLAIFEYYLLFYPLAYLFSGRRKKRVFILLTFGVLYCVKALSFGGRIEVLQFLLILFILHFDTPKISLRKIILIAAPILLFFVFFGIFRASPEMKLTGFIEIFKGNETLISNLLFGNQIDVYYSSTRLYGFCVDEILSIWDRIRIFLYNILAIVMPYSFLPPEADLAGYKKEEYFAGGGALFPVYFFVYLSYFGVLLVAIIFGYFLRRIILAKHKISNYFLIYMIMILSTFPRWYAYSANVFYKYCIYSVIGLFLLDICHRLIKGKRNKQTQLF